MQGWLGEPEISRPRSCYFDGGREDGVAALFMGKGTKRLFAWHVMSRHKALINSELVLEVNMEFNGICDLYKKGCGCR